MASLAVDVSLLKLSNEGAARQGNKEFLQFLYIALGSASELDTQIEISRKIGFSDGHRLDELQKHLETISKMIQGLIHSVKRKGPDANHQLWATARLWSKTGIPGSGNTREGVPITNHGGAR